MKWGLHGVEESGQSDPAGLGCAQESFHAPDGAVCSSLSSHLHYTGRQGGENMGQERPQVQLRGSRHPLGMANRHCL